MERNQVTKNMIVEDSSDYTIVTKCIVCGEFIPVSNTREACKMCDKCKRAVLYIRNSRETTSGISRE